VVIQQNASVAIGGVIEANGRGYGAGQGPGAGATDAGYLGWLAGGGGGHGRRRWHWVVAEAMDKPWQAAVLTTP